MLYGPTGSVIAGLDSASGSVVELISLNRINDLWKVEAAVDGQRYPAFYEPVANVEELTEDELMAHLKDQAIGFADYHNQQSV